MTLASRHRRHNMRLIHLKALTSALMASVLAIAAGAHTPDSEYQRRIQKWRADYEASLRADDGWLTLAGLFWLKEGINRFGSDATNEIVLPEGAPPHAGSFLFHAGQTQLEPGKEVPLNVNGKPSAPSVLQNDEKQRPDIVG